MSGSCGSRVGRHDGFVGIALTGKVAGGFVGLYVGTVASLLMIWFAVITRQTGVPARHVIPTQEAVVVVVEPLVGIGRVKAIVRWGGWNASGGCGSCSRWCGGVVVIIASSSTSTVIVASAAVVSTRIVRRILVRRGWWNEGRGGRCGGRSDGKKGYLLLCSSDGRAELGNAGQS